MGEWDRELNGIGKGYSSDGVGMVPETTNLLSSFNVSAQMVLLHLRCARECDHPDESSALV